MNRLSDVFASALCALACRLLLACLLGTAAAGAAAGPAGAPVPLAERLAQFEQQGRARPEEVSRELARLVATLPRAEPRRLVALCLQGRLLARLPDAQASEAVARELELMASDYGTLAQAAAGFVRAELLHASGNTARADRVLADVLVLLPDEAGVDFRVRLLLLAANVKDALGRFDDAVRLYQRALSLGDPISPNWLRSELRTGLAYTLFRVGQLEQARLLNHEGMEIARRAPADHVAWSLALATESILLTDAADSSAELAALSGAIEHARLAGSRRDEVRALANMADYYLRRADYQVAYERSQEALALARELRKPGSEAVGLINAGLAQIGLGHKEEGLALARAGLAIQEHTGAIADMSVAWNEVGQYLERAGQLKDALVAYREHRKLSEEVFNRDQQQAVLELQEHFDSERRAREIDLLHRENRLKQEQLRNRELQHRAWAAAAAVGVLLLTVFLLLHRRVRESNALLATHNERLLVQSERDPLTNLANRRHFQAAMRAHGDAGGFEGTLYLIDIDHFKQINDRHGHAAGDTVLVEIARRLSDMLRGGDLVVRWGGEEFLVLVRALAADQVEPLAARLLAAIAAQPVVLGDGTQLAVTGSVGFASFPLEPRQLAVGWERAIDVVDTAMYLAKAHGRNRAYGVRLLDAADDEALVRVTRALEASWRAGRVALSAIDGPQANAPAVSGSAARVAA